MPFKPGNQEGKKKKGVAHKSHIQDYLAYLAGGAARAYYQKLEEQAAGKELSKPEREFMDRFEKNTEFVAPKLSRRELVGDRDKPIQIEGINMLPPTNDSN